MTPQATRMSQEFTDQAENRAIVQCAVAYHWPVKPTTALDSPADFDLIDIGCGTGRIRLDRLEAGARSHNTEIEKAQRGGKSLSASAASRRFNPWLVPACCIGIIALAIVFFAIAAAEVGHRPLDRDA